VFPSFLQEQNDKNRVSLESLSEIDDHQEMASQAFDQLYERMKKNGELHEGTNETLFKNISLKEHSLVCHFPENCPF
jgi:hypothetical protein